MKKVLSTALLLLAALAMGFAESNIPPMYYYVSTSTGYYAGLGDYGYRQAIPLSFQSGLLSNSDDGLMALGFGMRWDIDFGVGASRSMLNMDILSGMDSIWRINRNLSLGVLIGLDIALVDKMNGDAIVTMGPGTVATLHFTPGSFSMLSLDVGLAAYMHIGLSPDDYLGGSVVPFVGFTFDFSDYPYLLLPYTLLFY